MEQERFGSENKKSRAASYYPKFEPNSRLTSGVESPRVNASASSKNAAAFATGSRRESDQEGGVPIVEDTQVVNRSERWENDLRPFRMIS